MSGWEKQKRQSDIEGVKKGEGFDRWRGTRWMKEKRGRRRKYRGSGRESLLAGGSRWCWGGLFSEFKLQVDGSGAVTTRIQGLVQFSAVCSAVQARSGQFQARHSTGE